MKRLTVLIAVCTILACTSKVTGPNDPADGKQYNPPPPTIIQETLDVMPETLGRTE